MKKQRGFTLMELLLAISIFAVIALCLYSVFSGGIRVWRKQGEGFKYTHGTRLALDNIAKELRNAIIYALPIKPLPGEENPQDLQFIGEKTKLSFMTLIGSDIAKVSYWFENNEQQGGVLKRIAFLQKTGFKDDTQKEEVLIQDLSDLSFEYAYPGESEEVAVSWKDSWGADSKDSKPKIPKGVRVTLTLKKSGENQNEGEIIKKTVFMPAGTIEKQGAQ